MEKPWNRIRKCFCAPVLYQAFLEIGSALKPTDHWLSMNARQELEPWQRERNDGLSKAFTLQEFNKLIPKMVIFKAHCFLFPAFWVLYMPTFASYWALLHCEKYLFACRLLCFYTLWCGCRISKAPHWSADYRFLVGCSLRGWTGSAEPCP